MSEVARLAEAYREAQGRAEEARSALYDAIRTAHRDGGSLRTLASESGLSFARIHQICQQP